MKPINIIIAVVLLATLVVGVIKGINYWTWRSNIEANSASNFFDEVIQSKDGDTVIISQHFPGTDKALIEFSPITDCIYEYASPKAMQLENDCKTPVLSYEYPIKATQIHWTGLRNYTETKVRVIRAILTDGPGTRVIDCIEKQKNGKWKHVPVPANLLPRFNSSQVNQSPDSAQSPHKGR